ASIIVATDKPPSSLADRPWRSEIERHLRDPFRARVLPDIQLGPVRQRQDMNGIALLGPRVVEAPGLGALIPRVPDVPWRTKGEHAHLGPALLLVASRAAEDGVEPPLIERLLQGLRLHHLGVGLRARGDRIDPAGQ